MSLDSQSADFLGRIQKLSPKRLALLAAELERRLATLEGRSPEPIAVIGMACRMPGGADTPDAFWTLLRDGVDAIQDVPSGRWDSAAVFDPQSGTPGRTNSRWGGFVSNVDAMDADFFGVSAREAVGMDPQQRLLLEVSWEALEDAAIRGDMLDGTSTGVFFGMSTSDYASLLGRNGVDGLDVYSGSGVARSVAAGRLSYLLGLKGPSLVVDTACSSSALALHLASQSLRGNECPVALAGGVNVMLSPAVTIALSQAHMLSGDGRCKTFSRRSDGFVRSEGCGVVVLKRLADAQAAGDRILGVLRGSATNHDGRSSGLTAPNGPAQTAVIRAALEHAQVLPAEIAYLEAHGTGTVLGDAIELGALNDVFSEAGRSAPLRIGSAKSNVGHLEAAAGITGLLKILLCFEHNAIPASLHSKGSDKNQALRDLEFHIPEQTEPWPEGQRRFAGLSSFGFSGSNVHLVVVEPPAATLPAALPDRIEVLTFSAKTAQALRDICGRYAAFLHERGAGLLLRDVAYTLHIGRAQFAHRVAFTAASIDEAAGRLEELSREGVEHNASYRHVPGFNAPSVAFLFTAQGSQYPGMGRDLYANYSVFREAVDRCDAIVADSLPHTFADILCGKTPPDLVHETAWTQPVLFTFEYALTELWRAWGIRPSIVLGHSLGEYVAACVADVFSLENALRLTLERGRLMSSLPSGGAMLAVRAGHQILTPLLAAYPDLSVAAVNGPQNVVLSGDAQSMGRLREELAAQQITAQPLTVSHAFHSAHMDPILEDFELFATSIPHRLAAVPIASNLQGRLLGEDYLLDARYWREHIRNPVRFAEGLDALLATKPAALLEIGPDPVLLGMARSAHPEIAAATLPSLRRSMVPGQTLNHALAQLFLLGAPIDWAQVWRDRPACKLSLPTYAFQRQRYWIAEPAPQQPPSVAKPIPTIPPASPGLLYTTNWIKQPLAEVPLNVETLMHVAAGSLLAASSTEPMRTVLPEYARFVPELNRLCSLYILEAFAELGSPLQKGSAFTMRWLEQRARILPAHQRLLGRLLAILAEDGLLIRDSDQWTPQELPITHAADLQKELMVTFPHFTSELAFLGRASELASVLCGKQNAVEVLFPGGSLQFAERVYQESPASVIWNRALAAAVQAAAKRLSSSRTVKIVEVGAGTGSATSQILPQLAGISVDYIFTDISSAFFAAARAKFAAYPFVRYLPFNLEEGIGPGSDLAEADIVIAANVVHATADLKHTLGMLRGLMRRGATLILLEATAVQRFGDLTVGMTEGWWRFTDVQRRPDYPLLDREGWLTVFAEAGFQVAAVPQGSTATELTANQSIFVATPEGVPTQVQGGCAFLGPSVGGEAITGAFTTAGFPAPPIAVTTNAFGPRQALPALLAQLRADTPLIVELPLEPAPDVPQQAMAAATFALDALQTLLALEPNSARTVWFLSRGALPVDAASVHIAGSVLDGLLKTAQLEHPRLCLRHVDLPAEPALVDWQDLVRLVEHGTHELSVALRGSRLLAPRVRPWTTPGSAPLSAFRFEAMAAYLVTGAFGGLGFRTVEWMAEHGARCLFLAGRRAPSSDLQERMRVLRSQGVQLVECLIDISQLSAVDALFVRIAAHGLPLRGIIHAAGSVDDATLLQQNQTRLASVFAAKVVGSYLLHRATRKLPLDFFVLFGSAASLLGSAGQSNHAAANSFLDALSELRQQQGLPSTTISWGAWAEIGAATRLKTIHQTSRDGFDLISVEEGLALLQRALHSGQSKLAALRIDWQRALAPGRPRALWPVFAELRPSAPEQTAATEASGLSLRLQLEAASAGDRLEVLKQYLRRCVMETMGAGASPSDDDQPLTELGLDSLLALQLKNELQSATGVPLPAQLFFEHTTIRMAATFIDAKLVATPEAFRRETETTYEELAF